MEPLIIDGTNRTPSIHFDPKTGDLKITGRSVFENPIKFYSALIEWLNKFQEEVEGEVNFQIRLEYLNTGSTRCLLDIFKRLEVIHKEKQNVTVHWSYEIDDESIIEMGKDYESILEIPFKFKTINYENAN